MPKILLYVFFFVCYLCWMVASFFSLNKVKSDLMSGKWFWSSELMLLEGLLGFFGSIYLLSGLWSLKLVLLILIASHLGGLVAWVLNSILGAPPKEAGIRTLWAGKEFDIKYRVVSATLGVVCGLLSLSYPFVAGVAFFRHPWGSPVLEILVVKYTLLLLTLSGYVVQVIVIGSLLSSENLDDDTRQRVFINQGIGLIPMAIFVALAFWAFELGGAPLAVGFLGIPAGTLSPQMLLLLLILFAVTLLIPYLAGTQLARRRSLALMGKIRDYFDELEDILEAPTARLYLTKLGEVRDKIVSTQEQFTSSDALLDYERQTRLAAEKAPAEDQRMVEAIAQTRNFDARFRFLDSLAKLEKSLEEAIADLQQRPAETIEDAARHWSEKYKTRKEELTKTIDAAASRKPFITAAAGSLVGTIVVALVSEVTKTGWGWILQAPK
jgi:hypothetical protein